MPGWRLYPALLLVGVLSPIAARACSSFQYQAGQMRQLAQALRMYHEERGHYPVSDAQSTWFQKLVAAQHVSPAAFWWRTPDGSLPLDLYGSPVVYQPPPPGSDDEPVIRCPGRNGRDDGGAGDDWQLGCEPRLGYWYKHDWPAIHACTVLWGLAAVMVAGWTWRKRREWPGVRGLLLVVGLGGLAMGIASYFNAGLARHTASHAPRWLDWFAGLGLLLVLGALIALARELRERYWERRLHVGLCQTCGYDLRGTLAAGRKQCPECGTELHPRPTEKRTEKRGHH